MDIYITGSNAYLLSTEFSTLLSGRYVEIRIVTYHNLFKDWTQIIDYVLYRGNVTATIYRVVTQPVHGRYVSDHFPVYADFYLN